MKPVIGSHRSLGVTRMITEAMHCKMANLKRFQQQAEMLARVTAPARALTSSVAAMPRMPKLPAGLAVVTPLRRATGTMAPAFSDAFHRYAALKHAMNVPPLTSFRALAPQLSTLRAIESRRRTYDAMFDGSRDERPAANVKRDPIRKNASAGPPSQLQLMEEKLDRLLEKAEAQEQSKRNRQEGENALQEEVARLTEELRAFFQQAKTESVKAGKEPPVLRLVPAGAICEAIVNGEHRYLTHAEVEKLRGERSKYDLFIDGTGSGHPRRKRTGNLTSTQVGLIWDLIVSGRALDLRNTPTGKNMHAPEKALQSALSRVDKRPSRYGTVFFKTYRKDELNPRSRYEFCPPKGKNFCIFRPL